MDKLYTLLYNLNNSEIKSQRELATKTGISLGMINSFLKDMKKEGYINFESKVYVLTEKGHGFLENIIKEKLDQRIVLPEKRNAIKDAVVLAAGQSKDFDLPVGLLSINGVTIIDRIINYLSTSSIEKIYLVTGFKSELYREHFKSNKSVQIIENNRYKWTGTMYSLSLTAPFIKDDFILVESDQLFEKRAISELINFDKASAVLISSATGSKDEAFVDLNDDDSIFKISKDKHQISNVDFEMVGISKISKLMFDKMLENYKSNNNPYINYEYVIENISRVFKVATLKIDNLVWCDIDTIEHFKVAKDSIYPELYRREQCENKKKISLLINKIMAIPKGEIENLNVSGGMTNNNWLFNFQGETYILRLPGICTQTMIDRKIESYNNKLATSIGINPESIYFDEDSGIKISRFIKNAETLTAATAKIESNIKLVTEVLKKLHNSGLKFKNTFDVFKEYEKYKKIANELNINYYDGFLEVEESFFKLREKLANIKLDIKPCHIDTVPENFVKDKNNKIYLVDWEYSGMCDPMWDIAAHILECNFSLEEEELFLSYYFNGSIDKVSKEKILIFKICQDILWSLWTLIKEASGENFGSYGKDRFKRGLNFIREYKLFYDTFDK